MKKVLISFLGITLFTFSSITAPAQIIQKSEKANCNIKINNQEYDVDANYVGYFPRICNVQPLAKIPVKLFYPDGTAGNKVILSVLDGGSFDNNKIVQVLLLDQNKKCSFNFNVTANPGLFRVYVRKGGDIKIIQLWVGEEPKAVKN